MKLSTKITLAFSGIAILSVTIMGITSISVAKKEMENEAFNKLTVIRELKANRIEAYFEQIQNHLLNSSESYMLIDAMKDFQNGFYNIKKIDIPDSVIDESLKTYYSNEYLPKLNYNSFNDYTIDDLYPSDDRTKKLQYLYISNNINATGEKQLLEKSEDSSEYSLYHAKYHPKLKSFVDKFGYYDIFLIDNSGHIVYSVYKETDFATSLEEGPYKNSNLAEVYKQTLSSGNRDFVKMIDFDNYLPSYNSSAAFIGTPIYDNEQQIGVLVFQLPVDRINSIMTDNGQWEKIGLGKSGETYLVGRDSLLRTQSRFLKEDKEGYLSHLEKEGYSVDAIHQINTLNNSIGVQKVTTKGVRNALSGKTGTETFNDYRGISVLSSYRPIAIKDVDWVIMSEIDKKEAFSAIDGFVQGMLIFLIIIILLIPILSIYFSKGITNPLKKLSNITKRMAQGETGIRVNLKREDEIGILANNFDSMSNSVEQIMNQLEEANDSLEEKIKLRTKEVEDAHFKTQSIINNANDAIITIDENQTIILINPAALKVFGYSEKEILGSSLTELLPKSFRQNHHKHIDTFKHSKEKAKQMSTRTQVMGKRKTGEEFYAEVSISKQIIDGEFQFTAFLKDITERKLLELKIEEANKRMENELNIGKEIQMSMLPLIFPAFPNHSEFNIFALLESAREVGGDFYDFYFIEENKFLFTIADVSGKGVPSALFMAVAKTLIKSRANEDDSPASIITFVNDELSRDNKTSMFVTLFLCIIDLSTGELKYTNAGHNPPYLKRVNGEIETLNTLHGPVVGAVEDFVYKENSLIMHANDVLLLFTDGVNEAMNIKSELFNNEPIIESLNNFKGKALADDVKGLYNSVKAFEGEAEQADDITILAFEYLEPLLKDIIYTKEITINNELAEIDRINEIFNALCEQYKIPGVIYRKFNIAFDELINNIVSYGYNDDNEHEINIRITITEEQLQVSIEDDGIAFNPLKSGDPDINASIEDREIGGLGIHMVKKLMDNVSYKRYPKKNLTTLYKKIK